MWTEEIVAERPAWRHTPSGVVFREVPGGIFLMGLSEAELAAVRSIERGGGAEDTLAPFFAAAGNAQPVREVTGRTVPDRPAPVDGRPGAALAARV
jgi:hypothetical protein